LASYNGLKNKKNNPLPAQLNFGVKRLNKPLRAYPENITPVPAYRKSVGRMGRCT
jgi:hypothetical protein